MKPRAAVLALLSGLVLLGATVAAPVAPASAAPATGGWHDGFCKPDEGLTVVLDFGPEVDRAWQARCRVGGTYPAGSGESRVDALESVGYSIELADGGYVGKIDGVGTDEFVDRYWCYTARQGPGAWGGQSELPGTNHTNWFYGVRWSDGSVCAPRVVPQFAPEAVVAVTAASTTYGSPLTVTVGVTAAQGGPASGEVTLRGAGSPRSAALSAGVATYTLPATTRPGSYRLTASFRTAEGTTVTSAVRTVSVLKGVVARVTARVSTKPTTKRRGRVTVRVIQRPGLAAPSGKVTVLVERGRTKRTVKGTLNRTGQVTLRLPQLAKGRWRLTPTYRGDTSYVALTGARLAVVAR